MERVLVHEPHSPVPHLCYVPCFICTLPAWLYDIGDYDSSLTVMGLNTRRTMCGSRWIPLGKWDQGKSVVWKIVIFHFYPSVQFEPIQFEPALWLLCLFVYMSLSMSISYLAIAWPQTDSEINLQKEWRDPMLMEGLNAIRKLAFKAVNGSVLGVHGCYKK